MQLNTGAKGGIQTVSTGGTGLSFARKQDNAAVKSLGAKKLDIDFNSDDFFNSFQPVPAADDNANPFGNKPTTIPSKDNKSNKLKELNADPFGLGSGSAAAAGGMSINLGMDDEKSMNEREAQERLKQLQNRKAISSEDFVNYNSEQ